MGLVLPSPKAILHLKEHPQTASDNDILGKSEPKEAHREDTIQVWGAFKERRDEFINLLREFQAMWYGRLGIISATKHRISLLKVSKLVYQPPYRAGHSTRDFEEEAVDLLLKDGVM